VSSPSSGSVKNSFVAFGDSSTGPDVIHCDMSALHHHAEKPAFARFGKVEFLSLGGVVVSFASMLSPCHYFLIL